MKKTFSLILSFVLILSLGTMSFANIDASMYDGSLEAKELPENSEVRYVQSLAEDMNISYEKAYEINQEENEKYFSSKEDDLFSTRSLDEEIRYKTIYDNTPIEGSENYVVMGSEVKFVYSITQDEAIEIMDITATYMTIPGVTSYSIEGGNYGIDVSVDSARISRIASLEYEVQNSTGISAGIGDILSISETTTGTFIVNTYPITFVQNIGLYELE